MKSSAVMLACAAVAACGPSVRYMPRDEEVRPPRKELAVEVLRTIPAHCVTREIGYLETNCAWRWRERMRAVAARHGADALTGFAELDLRSAQHLPRDGNVCSAVAVVFVGTCDRGGHR